jgi:hypothetical protein
LLEPDLYLQQLDQMYQNQRWLNGTIYTYPL